MSDNIADDWEKDIAAPFVSSECVIQPPPLVVLLPHYVGSHNLLSICTVFWLHTASHVLGYLCYNIGYNSSATAHINLYREILIVNPESVVYSDLLEHCKGYYQHKLSKLFYYILQVINVVLAIISKTLQYHMAI